MTRTFCVEIRRAGRVVYIGKVEATLAEIRRTFPYSEIEGNRVTIFSVACD